jgi:hypothetical protein
MANAQKGPNGAPTACRKQDCHQHNYRALAPSGSTREFDIAPRRRKPRDIPRTVLCYQQMDRKRRVIAHLPGVEPNLRHSPHVLGSRGAPLFNLDEVDHHGQKKYSTWLMRYLAPSEHTW